MSNAIETQGWLFSIGNGDSPLTYTEVGLVTNFTGLDGEAADIDVTTLQSTSKEYLQGIPDQGNFSIDIFFSFTDAGQVLMRAAKASREIQDFKATFSDNTELTFRGFVKSAPISGGVDAAVEGSYNIRISGDTTFA